MKYIYESPNNGKTVFRRPLGCHDPKMRELVKSQNVLVDVTEDGVVVIQDLTKQ